MQRLIVGCVSVALVGGCAARDLTSPDLHTCAESYKDIPVERNRDLDILFVVDNSGSMGEEQASLGANFHRFVSVLETLPDGLPSLHIGVVSTDLGAGPFGIDGCAGSGDNGSLQSAPRVDGCEPPSGAFLSDIPQSDGTRIRNYTGDLGDAFACIAQLGTSGCGFEQPLEAMRRALNGSNPTNVGFLRENAFLLVVFITDEDDCSVSDTSLFDPDDTSLGLLSSFRCFEHGVVCDPDQPRAAGEHQGCRSRQDSAYMTKVADYVAFLRGLKADPYMVAVAAIAGPSAPVLVSEVPGGFALDPVCTTASGSATPAVRIAELMEAFPGRSTLQTICNEDLSGALGVIANGIVDDLGSPCLEGQIDADPETEGLQYDCRVSEFTGLGTDQPNESLIPECASATPMAGELPCWVIRVDPQSCPDTVSQAAFEVIRGEASVHSAKVVVRCAAKCTL